MEPKAEFDRYAKEYDALLRDPVRDAFAQTSEFFHRRKWILIEDFFERQALSLREFEWLDVGCGRGELLKLGASRFKHVTGCDLSLEMVRNLGGIDVHLQKTADILPFADASFDFVTAVCVYHHVEDVHRLALAREIYRVLRPGAIFCMIEHNPLNPATRMIVSRSPLDVDAHLLSVRSAKRYAVLAGLQLLESQFFLYLPERLYDYIGRLEGLLRGVPLGGQYAVFARK